MKKVFLTGASSGIGLATATALLARGHEVWGTSREIARIPEAKGLHGLRLDLADPASIQEAFARALEQAGVLDVVINNAGSGHFGPAEHLSEEALAAQFQTSFFAQVALCRLALAAMQREGRGLIINVTSLASRLPVPFTAGYNAAKAALATFTMTMQLELETSGIKVVELQPADINTGFYDPVPKAEVAEPHYARALTRAWSVVDGNMKRASGPELVAQRIVRLLGESNPPPRITVGDPFQCVCAPLLYSLLPPRLRVWGLRKYYGI